LAAVLVAAGDLAEDLAAVQAAAAGRAGDFNKEVRIQKTEFRRLKFYLLR
jgi:hypothetical protein